jgi:hypothetical protein
MIAGVPVSVGIQDLERVWQKMLSFKERNRLQGRILSVCAMQKRAFFTVSSAGAADFTAERVGKLARIVYYARILTKPGRKISAIKLLPFKQDMLYGRNSGLHHGLHDLAQTADSRYAKAYS